MNKYLCLISGIILTLSLAACTTSSPSYYDSNSNSNSSTSTSSETTSDSDIVAAQDSSIPSFSESTSESTLQESNIEVIFSEKDDSVVYSGTTASVVDVLYSDLSQEQLPKLITTELTDNNIEVFFTSPDIADYIVEGTVSEPLMSSIAHSVAVLKTETTEDAKDLASILEKTINPRKWVCVEAEQTYIIQRGNIVLVSMTPYDISDSIKTAFMEAVL